MTATKTRDAPKTAYIVRWNGAVVGTKQNTNVRYTHAVIGQVEEKGVREWAYATANQDDEYRSLYDHYEKYARDEPDSRYRAEYAARIEGGGFDVFVKRLREQRIKWFKELRQAEYPFAVHVLRWLKAGETNKMRQGPIAFEMYPGARSHRRSICDLLENGVFSYDWTKVVPVETETSIPVAQRFARMPKKSQRDLLGLVCDKMIERQAWDEIAGLLTHHLEGDAPLVLKLLGGQR